METSSSIIVVEFLILVLVFILVPEESNRGTRRSARGVPHDDVASTSRVHKRW
jgi:hypothetical protein